MRSVISGTIQAVDHRRGVILLGALQLSVPERVSLMGLTVGDEVIAAYQEKNGQYWLTSIRGTSPITPAAAS